MSVLLQFSWSISLDLAKYNAQTAHPFEEKIVNKAWFQKYIKCLQSNQFLKKSVKILGLPKFGWPKFDCW